MVYMEADFHLRRNAGFHSTGHRGIVEIVIRDLTMMGGEVSAHQWHINKIPAPKV